MALPLQAKRGQLIRLPGQTRVAPEEYREFLALGHGGIFDLDLDRLDPASAVWRQGDAVVGDFFNYDLDEAGWREYCARVKDYREQCALLPIGMAAGAMADADLYEDLYGEAEPEAPAPAPPAQEEAAAPAPAGGAAAGDDSDDDLDIMLGGAAAAADAGGDDSDDDLDIVLGGSEPAPAAAPAPGAGPAPGPEGGRAEPGGPAGRGPPPGAP